MTDNAPRPPSPTENHLLINAYTTHPQSPLLAVTRRIADSGCNLVDTRLSTVGRDVSVSALATASHDPVASADMFSAQVTVGIPSDMHIAALRDDFLEFCDHLNLDAIMDPMKF